MAYSVLNLKADLTGIIHGTTLNQITNLNGLIYRAARQVLQDVDPQETKRVTQFATPIFEGVYSYALAPDVKGNKVIDIFPQVNRLPSDVYNQDYSQQFSLSKLFSVDNQFNIDFNSGVKTIQVNSPLLNTGVVVNSASGTNLNGTWTVGGGATNLVTDNTNFVTGSGSLRFDLSAGQSSGYLENSTMSAVDLTNYANQSTFFEWTSLPTASAISSVELRWGSSPTNYYSLLVSVTQAGTIFQNGWNELAHPWSAATVTGSPVLSSIKYIRVTWTYNGTLQTSVRLNGISDLAGKIMSYSYYSKYLFRDALTGAFQETITDDSNLINLDTDSYNLLLDMVVYLTSQQLQGIDAQFGDAPFFQQQYQGDLVSYKSKYKSEIQKPRQKWYNIRKTNYTGYLGRRY